MSADHRLHDRLLIARYAADDSYPAELEEARAQVAVCAECAALADDIKVLARAVADVPAPPRVRDFRLTTEQADKLRGSWLERLMRRFAAPGMGTLRPVAGVALSIGLVMAVAGALPSLAPVGPATQQFNVEAPMDAEAPPPTADGMGAPAESAPPPGMETVDAPGGAMSPVTAAATDPASRSNPSAEPGNDDFNEVYLPTPDTAAVPSDTDLPSAATDTTSTLLTYGGLLIALASLGVLMVAWLARRRFSDPLLR